MSGKLFFLMLFCFSDVFAGKQTDDGWQEFIFPSSVDGEIRPYTAYNLPSISSSGNDGKKLSFVVFLNGAGASGETSRWGLISVFSKEELELARNFGIIVVLPEPRPVVGGSQATFYVSSPVYPTGEQDVLDCLSAVREEVQSRGFIPGKNYVAGGSMGGLGALNLIGRYPELFSGVLAFAPPVDLKWTYERLKDLSWDFPGPFWENILASLTLVCGGEPGSAKAREIYEEFSPINVLSRNWDKLEGKTILVVHGGMDDQILPSEFFRLLDLVVEKSGSSPSPLVIPVFVPEGRHDRSVVSFLPLWSLIASERDKGSSLPERRRRR